VSKYGGICVLLLKFISLQTAETAKEELKTSLKFLDEYLLTRTYLVGERITLADIVLSLTMTQLYTHVLDNNFR
jgi:elongation factor 1-gamma